MIVTCVTVYVKEEHLEDFVAATVQNHEGSIQEAGNMRFDVLQHKDDPTRFLLYEAYESEEAAKAHKDTEHYLRWRDAVAPWMARPREGIAHRVIRPADRNEW
jgi:autoinducer 2-degrading protein